MSDRPLHFGKGSTGYDLTSSPPAYGPIGPWSLFKLCRREHNIALGATTLRLGSMAYYQSFDDADIGDAQEGVKTIWAPRDDGVAIPVHHMTPFNLIFCAAQSHVVGFSDYDSCYEITDPILFGRLITGELIEQVTPSQVDVLILDNLELLRGIETLAHVQGVGFEVERRIVRYLSASEVTDDDYSATRIPFWKSDAYAQQDEYRYVFRAFREGSTSMLSSFNGDYIDLDITAIADQLPVRAR